MQCSCTSKDPHRAHDLGVVLFCPYPDCDRSERQIGGFEVQGGHLVLLDKVRGRAVRRFAPVTEAGKQEAFIKVAWEPGSANLAVDVGSRTSVSLTVAKVLAAARDGDEQLTL